MLQNALELQQDDLVARLQVYFCRYWHRPAEFAEKERAVYSQYLGALLTCKGGSKMKMKESSSLAAGAFLAGALLLLSPATAQQDAARPPASPAEDVGATPGHLPKAHYVASRAPEMTYPMWIDSSEILNEDGTINTTLIHPQGVREIQGLRSIPQEGGCTQVGTYFQDQANPPTRSTPEQAAQSARLVILGKVTEKAYGLKVDIPGQLLHVVPEEVLKGQPRDVDAYFVFLPVGIFKLGNLKICKTDSRYAEPPSVGDEVLLFAPLIAEWPRDQHEPFLDLRDDGGLITIHAGGKVSQPKRYETTPTSAFSAKEDLLGRVRAAVSKVGN
jgi:hypothetical protein